MPRSAFNAGTGILHYLVLVQPGGFRIKGCSKLFPSLGALVVHHSVMRESLPVRLRLGAEDEEGGSSAASSDRDSDFADVDSEPEFPVIVNRLREQLSA